MKSNKNKLADEIRIDTSNVSSNRQSMWLLWFLTSFSALCSYMGFSDGFKVGSSLFVVLMTSVILGFVIQLLLEVKRWTKPGLAILGGVIVVYIIAASRWLINGFTIIANSLITYVNEHKAEAHLKYVVSNKTKSLDLTLAVMAIVIIYTVVLGVLIRYRRVFVVAVLMLVATMSNMFFNGEDQYVWIALSLIMIVLIIYLSNIRIFRAGRALKVGTFIVTALGLVSIIFVVFVRYTGIRSVDDLKDEIEYHAGNIIYGKSDFPEGSFRRFDEPPVKDKETRLTVEMTNPVSMHLKGYVGCQYTEKGWTSNEEKIYGGKNKGMIEWFLEQGYYPLTQAGYYMGYSRNKGGNLNFKKIRNSSIHIKNKSASTKYEYVSENLLDMSGLIDPKQDVNFVEQDLWGEKEYWYDILYFKDENYLQFPTQQWFENKGAGSLEERRFVKAENYYHGFASTYYLKVPKAEREILSANIPACSNNVADAIRTVRHYLKDQIKYSKDVEEFTYDENYLKQFMLKDRRGYSPHFATAATLMFRYYGVPARYVEGYLMENEKDKRKINLHNTDAHAWVEVYIKGLGFVPVEVTPGYYQEDELGGAVKHKQHKQINKGGGGGTSGVNNDEVDEFIKITWQMVVTFVAILLVIALIVTAIVLVIRRFVLAKKRRELIESEDEYVAVAAASQYLDDVCVWNHKDFKLSIPDDVRMILEKVKFSQHPLLLSEKTRVVDCCTTMVEEIWSDLNWRRKLIMMFIKGLK